MFCELQEYFSKIIHWLSAHNVQTNNLTPN